MDTFMAFYRLFYLQFSCLIDANAAEFSSVAYFGFAIEGQRPEWPKTDIEKPKRKNSVVPAEGVVA